MTAPDLFIWLYDGLELAEFRRCLPEWEDDPFTDSTAGAIEADAREGKLTRQSLQMRLDNGGTRSVNQIRYACLLGLDRAFMSVNDSMATVAQAELQALAVDTAVSHRLDSGQHEFGGALLTKPVRRYRDSAQEHPLPQHPRDAFESVIRVPQTEWTACEFVQLSDAHVLLARDFEPGVLVATTPLIADPDEMEFTTLTRGQRRFYRIEPRDLDVIQQRIPEIVAKMDAAEAIIGMAPELTLTPPLLEAWRRALADPGRRRPSRLRWVLAGSGNVLGDRTRVNTAVILDARRGTPIATQAKTFPFNLGAEELRRWQLTGKLGSRLIHEDIDPASRLRIFEAGEIRFAVLVCEDAARVEDFAPLLRAFAVSHAFVPIFGRPVHQRRWERAAADTYGRGSHATVLVANSAVIRTLTSEHGTAAEPRGTGLAVWPDGAVLLDSDDPAGIACVRLIKDGSVEAV